MKVYLFKVNSAPISVQHDNTDTSSDEYEDEYPGWLEKSDRTNDIENMSGCDTSIHK